MFLGLQRSLSSHSGGCRAPAWPLLCIQEPQTISGIPHAAKLCPKDLLCLQPLPMQTGCVLTPALSPALTCNHRESRETFVAAPQPTRPAPAIALARTAAAVPDSCLQLHQPAPNTLRSSSCKSIYTPLLCRVLEQFVCPLNFCLSDNTTAQNGLVYICAYINTTCTLSQMIPKSRGFTWIS